MAGKVNASRYQDERKTNVVPWRDPDQFHKVYQCLYSASITDKRWAVDQISVWETRCYPTLPKAVEATALLVRAQIQDTLLIAGKTFCQDKDAQMMYSIAIVRFVSLFTEIQKDEWNYRNKSRKSSILESEFQKVGIPKWMIDLRNEAAHANCPSLALLRLGVEKAMAYLQRTFWVVEAANIRPIRHDPVHPQQEYYFSLIQQYRDFQMMLLAEKQDELCTSADLETIVDEIRDALKVDNEKRNKFIDILVDPDNFICIADIFKLSENSAITFVEFDEEIDLPEKLEEFWMPMLSEIHEADMMPTFLERLLLSQVKYSARIAQKMVVAWALYILLATSEHAPKTLKLTENFQRKGAVLDYNRLLYASLMGFNKYTLRVFSLLKDRLGGDPSKYHSLCELIALYTGMCLDYVPPQQKTKATTKMDELIFTVDEMEEDINDYVQTLRTQRTKTTSKNIWSLAPTSIDFSQLPLGAVINSAVEEDEEMEEDETSSIEEETRPFFIENKEDQALIAATLAMNVDQPLQIPDNYDIVYRAKREVHTTI